MRRLPLATLSQAPSFLTTDEQRAAWVKGTNDAISAYNARLADTLEISEDSEEIA